MKVDKTIQTASPIRETMPLYQARMPTKNGSTARIMPKDRTFARRLTRIGKPVLTK